MADEQEKEPEGQPNEGEERAAAGRSGARRPSLTPEQRRFLNKPRAEPNEPPPVREGTPKPSPAPVPPQEPSSKSRPERKVAAEPAKAGETSDPDRPPQTAAPLQGVEKASRAIELQQALLILGGLLILCLAFYGGTKLNYLKYLIASRNAPKMETKGPDLFPGIAPEDLVRQAIAAERDGKWQDAVERFMAAKRKDLRYRGILFRVGKILYEHRNFDSADNAFERAILFGENIDVSNYYRGLIAVRRRDLQAAEHFFELAINAEPFVSDYHYYLAETLRLDLKPKDSLPHYQQALLLSRNAQDETVCQFKVRMGRIEAAEGATVSAELAKQQAAGPLSVAWLMTAAALQLRGGNIEQTRELILQARAGSSPGLFASCVNDIYFHGAAEKYPELAEALHLDLDLQVPFPD